MENTQTCKTAERIAIVDDEKTQMLALCDTLRRRGYETTGFTSAREALLSLSENKYDLLLSDLIMPEMDGITLISNALKLDPDLAAIIMTGNGSISSAVRAMKSGSFDYVLKPFKLKTFLPVIVQALRMRLQHTQEAEQIRQQRDQDTLQDQLTGLPNRNQMIKKLSDVIARARQEYWSATIVLINIKRFKDINDSFGRDVGDSLLQQVAERLSEVTEGAGFPARIQADTFAWIAYESACTQNNMQVIQESINRICNRPFIVAGTEIRLGTHAGMARFPDHGTDAESLFNNVEAALKHARMQRESFACYSADLHARVTERLTMESKLRRAIEQEEFVLYFQPKVDVITGKITGLEALIRWHDPEGGLVPPLAFISLLEETGLIIQVSRWLMRETARIVSGWHARGLPLVPIAMNISPIELSRPDFIQSVEEMLKTWPAGAPRFSLEITESAIMADITMIGPKLKAIEQMGVEIAIDDFGTGCSSLAYLAELPAGVVKIDRSFIRNIDTNEEQKTIVSLIISLAHTLNKVVVAEGVETEGQLACLRQLQCEQYQGYLLSRPEPEEKIEKLLLQVNSRQSCEFPRAVNCCAWPAAAGRVQAC